MTTRTIHIECENGHVYDISQIAYDRLCDARDGRTANAVYEGFAAHVPPADRLGVWNGCTDSDGSTAKCDSAEYHDWEVPTSFVADHDLTDYCGLQADLADCDDGNERIDDDELFDLCNSEDCTACDDDVPF